MKVIKQQSVKQIVSLQDDKILWYYLMNTDIHKYLS